MKISTQILQEKCKKILDAIGNKKGIVVDKVELKVESGTVYLSITDREYYLTVPVAEVADAAEEGFRVVVEADKFLKLISKITTETVTLKASDGILRVKGNGDYKLPVIADNKTGQVIELPKIAIHNVTSKFNIKNAILQSMLKYNAKLLGNNGVERFPFVFMDEKGAITYTNNACINAFALEQPVALYLSEKLVKLFKLFRSENVDFTLGFDELPNGILQQKVCFSDGDATLYAILTTDNQVMDSFPASSLRGLSEKVPPHTAVISKAELIGALDRIALFRANVDSKIAYAIRMNFSENGVTIEDYGKNNSEAISYSKPCATLAGGLEYDAVFNVDDLYLILANCEDEYLTISFGSSMMYLTKANIINIIPEYRQRGC